jgi:anti-sigma regulatory factor (Ser/Thr protein kinase)
MHRFSAILAKGGSVGAGETRRLSVPANDEGIRAALDALGALWDEAGVSPALTWPVEVSLDEVLANVVRHGLRGRGESARVELELRLEPGDPPLCELRLSDDGPEFDPLAAAAPDTALGLDERPIGGLGIELVKRLMDEVEYERRDGRNRLRLARRLRAIEPSGA